VTTAAISPEVVANDIVVSDEMITAYYDDNPKLYQLPETADVEYVEISRSDVAATVSVSEDDLREYYELNSDRYLQDEQRQARHILVLFGDDENAAEATALDLLARAQAGESFEDLARENSQDGGTAAQGGDLGVLTRTQLPGELGSSIFSMDEGTIEGPVRTDFGFHVIRLERILERGPLPIEQVRGELTAELQEQQAESLFRDLERKLSDALFDATDIQALATAVGSEVKTVAGFTRLGGEPFGTNQAAIDAIFDESLLTGSLLSEIVELDANRSAVFAVTNHKEATRQPLAEVRDAGEEFAAAAESIGATVAAPTAMSRNMEDVDQLIAVAVFTAVKPTEGKPTTGSTRNSDGGFTVFSLDAVIPGRPEAIPLAERDSGKLQLADQSGISDFVAFVQALRANADVVINEDVLAAQDLFQ
jgi:peptidyl-prolyl cis-trans isomerase D